MATLEDLEVRVSALEELLPTQASKKDVASLKSWLYALASVVVGAYLIHYFFSPGPRWGFRGGRGSGRGRNH